MLNWSFRYWQWAAGQERTRRPVNYVFRGFILGRRSGMFHPRMKGRRVMRMVIMNGCFIRYYIFGKIVLKIKLIFLKLKVVILISKSILK